MHQVVFFCLVLCVLAVDINVFPAKIAMPITFYDYEYYYDQIVNRLNDKDHATFDLQYETDMKNDNDPQSNLLCDFNICQQADRKKKQYCPNHEHANAMTGFVQEELVDGRPHLKSSNKNDRGQTQKSYLVPHLWYTENRYSRKVERNVTLNRSSITSSGVPLYSFNATKDFFFINNDGWDLNKNTGKPNYVFATHFHAAIKYSSDSNEVTISSDDDSWLFIDGKLAIDYGGTRAPNATTFIINNDKFENNKEYTVDFFHADRCYTQASFSIFGPLTCDITIGGKTDSDKDGVPDCQDGCPFNKYLVDAKEGCTCDSKTTSNSTSSGEACITCDMIISESLCNGINSDNVWNPSHKIDCEWCPNGNNGNGKCKTKGSCECTELAADDRCPDYVRNGQKTCDLCIVSKGSSTIGCNTKTQCECGHFKTLADCASAANSQYNCIWCGNECVDGSVKNCPDCSSYSTAEECLQVYNTRENTVANQDTTVSACNWCTNGDGGAFNNKNGKCVKGECNCKDPVLFIKDDNEATNGRVCGNLTDNYGNPVNPNLIQGGIGYHNKLSDFNNNVNKKDQICDYCISSESCLKATEKCNLCHMYDNDEAECNRAADCLFCGNSCIDKDSEQCDPCKEFNNDQERCSNAYVIGGDGMPTTEKCVFCQEGMCQNSTSECLTCDEINNSTTEYKTKYFTLSSAAKNCTSIDRAYSDVDSDQHPNYQKFKEECEANTYCSFSNYNCASLCDVQSNKENCEKLDFCKYSSSCSLKNETDIKNELNKDIASVRARCLAQVYNKCDFCGYLNFYYENVTVTEENSVDRVFYYPNLCVSSNSETKCPECESLVSAYNNNLSDDAAKKLGPGTYTVIHRLSDGTAENSCSSLSIEYNDASTDSNKIYSGLQVCGYCEGTGKCVALGNPQEFFNTTDKQRADYLFYSKQCDSDCHLYTKNTYCYKSKLDCSWCKFQNGTALCYNSTEECPACKEYTTAYRCSDAGCRWCDLSSNCVTGNKDCPELSAIVGIAAGIIAAIIIAAVVGVALSAFASKKIYDAINEARETSMDSATSNPLYAEGTNGGTNPVFEEN